MLPKEGDDNIKPSLLQRQKSNDSLEQSPLVARKLAHTALAKSFASNEDDGSMKISTPTGSFGRVSPNNNKSQGVARTSSAGSKESLGSIGLPSDKVLLILKGFYDNIINFFLLKLQLTSYESTSSLNSDGLKTGAGHDNEHYYDSVPIDNIEDDYVYIKPGSLQKDEPTSPTEDNHRKQIKSVLEPESPGRNSNYVNIDYFLQYV